MRPIYEVSFRYALLKRDLGFALDEVPELFRRYYDVDISRAAVFFWFSRGSMPEKHLTRLLHLVRLKTNRQLDYWRYIDAPNPFATLADEDRESA